MRQHVTLVLSSGGSRGLAHIGVIEELEKSGYIIDAVAGCSMGSLVGGVYAAGGLQQLKEWFLDMTLKKMFALSDIQISARYVMKGEKIISA
ncbi:MAG: patatin-like phospholipase family protein, partial [Bacteroidales bacterium]|nr:patatin-like phospholipase family protein [Bacteroidales bacterium]